MLGDKPLLNFVVEPELLDELNEYRHRHRFPSRAAAIKALLRWAVRQDPQLGRTSSREELERALASAPVDDEPETEEERAAVEKARKAIARGEVRPWEGVL